MSANEIDRAIARMAYQIIEPEGAHDSLLLIGIRRGGEMLSRRLGAKIAEITGKPPRWVSEHQPLPRRRHRARVARSEIRNEITGRSSWSSTTCSTPAARYGPRSTP